MGFVDIVIAPSNQPPFPVEAVVLEEDTHRVMSAGNRIIDLPDSIDESIDELTEFTPHEVGELIIEGNRLYAVVHDFDFEPSFNETAARRVLFRLAELATATGFEHIAIQVFRGSPDDCGYQWIQDELRSALEGTPLQRVWLISR